MMTGQEAIDQPVQYAIRVQYRTWDGKLVDTLVRDEHMQGNIFVTECRSILHTYLLSLRKRNPDVAYTPVILQCFRLDDSVLNEPSKGTKTRN